MFAIVRIGNKQYKVAPRDVIEVQRLDAKEGDELTFDDVLLVTDGKKTKIGTPTVKGASVKVKVVGEFKGEKISVRRYKSKVRYRKATGFRAQLTRLEVTAVS